VNPSEARGWKYSAREVALPTAAASSRVRRSRSSGSNGSPLTIPIAASQPHQLAFVLPAGSSCTTSFMSSKKPKSLAAPC
jgi:hypothetical protein